MRCGYTVIPKEVSATTLKGERVFLNKLWHRRQCSKFNGTSYITQRGAEAVYSPEGKKQIRQTINYYMNNAKLMKEGLEACGLQVYGGTNAPYLWVKTPMAYHRGSSLRNYFMKYLLSAHPVSDSDQAEKAISV